MGDSILGATALLSLLGIVLCVVWIILPFAIFGTKPLLRELIRETQRTNQLLEQIAASSRQVSRRTENIPLADIPARKWPE